MSQYVQYGCGLSAPEQWINYDASPTLRLQKIPLLTNYFKRTNFPKNVRFGDITKGLPGVNNNSCDGIYCSHVLEHLSLTDCRRALKNTFELLKDKGKFRCVLPDLENLIEEYIKDKQNNTTSASIIFMKNSLLGYETRPNGIKDKLISLLGNSHHLWMWDKYSLSDELYKAGFRNVRECKFNDSADPNFKFVEEENRFYKALALEAEK